MEGAEKAQDETTEFFVPRRGLDLAPYIAHRDVQGIHHLSRYHWATRVLEEVAPRRVLDVACGAGYGSFLLADTLPGVIEHHQSVYVTGTLSKVAGPQRGESRSLAHGEDRIT